MALICKATGGDLRQADLGEVRRSLQVLADPEHGIQLQYAPFHSESFATFAGSDLDGMAEFVKRHEDAKGIYYIHNPVPLGLNHSALVPDILYRRFLFIDVDRNKDIEPKQSATDAEHERAGELAQRVKNFLAGFGWPAPLLVDSGNGWQLLNRINLANTGNRNDLSRQLVKAVLDALAFRFASENGSVDTSTCDARRLAKLPGTWARRGEQSAERPWRIARLVELPPFIEAVDPELMRETVAKLRERTSETRAEPAAETSTTPAQASIGPSDQTPETETAQTEVKPHLIVTATSGASIEQQAIAYLATIPGGVEGQKGSCPTLWAARVLVRGFCLGVERSLQILQSHYNQRCIPPWPEHLLRRKVEQARDAEFNFPWGWLLNETSPNTKQPEERGWAEGDIIVYPASSVLPRNVDWLWLNRIPIGKLTTFAGVGGLGKTFVLLDVAARVSRGLPWPDSEGECAPLGNTLFLSGEDEPEDTLVPRLMELGADLSRIFFLKTEVQDRFTLADLPTLSTALEQASNVKFVAIDPPTAFLGGVNDHKNAELRGLLSPLKSWSHYYRCAVTFNTHFTKPQGQKVEAMMRVMGSVAWVNAVRAAHMFARDPEDEKRERRLFVPMKNNLGPEQKGLAYKLAFEPNKMAKIEWLGSIDTTADEAANAQKKEPGRGVIASEWMIERFREKREWPSDELFRQAGQDGVSRSAVFDAKRLLELPRARRVVGNNGDVSFVWWVPENWPALNLQPEDQEDPEGTEF